MLHPCLTRSRAARRTGDGANGSNGAGPGEPAREPDRCLAEAVSLAESIGLDIAFSEVIRLQKPRPGTLFGPGRVEALAVAVEERGLELVIVDGALTAVQQRNLERSWGCKVIDRTALILEIFAERARTREGRLQVELAALSYQRSRLVRSWTHLERQRGGYGFVGGPGETQIEADRRQIKARIGRLESALDGVKRTRGLHREARRKVPYPVVALVGYTNAGKSTLFNRLTGAETAARDRLFATLDPTMRGLTLPSGLRAILSDTVGFVSDLPHDLVAAFRATLEEVLSADLIVHVRDCAHADTAGQRADVIRVLAELGLEDRIQTDVIDVLNKLDLLDHEQRAGLASQGKGGGGDKWVAASALTGEGLDALIGLIDARLAATRRVVEVRVPCADGATLAWLYRHGEVLHRIDDGDETRLQVGLTPADTGRLGRRPGISLDTAPGHRRESYQGERAPIS